MNSPVLFQSLTRFRLFFYSFSWFHLFYMHTEQIFCSVLFSSVVLALQSIIIMEYLRLITSYSDKVKKYKQQQQQISQVNKKNTYARAQIRSHTHNVKRIHWYLLKYAVARIRAIQDHTYCELKRRITTKTTEKPKEKE